MRRLAFALLLLCMAGASAAQPKPFSYRVYDMWGRPIVRIDMTPDSILVLQSDSVQVRLLPMVFEGMARDYIKYADSIRTGAQFEFGLDDDHFVFSFRQPWLLIPSFLALVLLLLGSIAVLLRYRRRLARLHADQARVAEQRRLVEQGREQERLQLARDLHDGPLQALYALRIQLARRTPDLGAQDLAIEQIADHLRSTTSALRAPLLTQHGLSTALRELAIPYPAVEVTFVLDEAAEARLDQHARTALYRVAQEGLSNAVRHGGATRVTLELAGHEENVRLTVQDNGAGFDTRTPLQAYGTSGHYGLIGIHERIEVLGGRVRLQSGPEGTRLEVTLPAGPEAPVRHRGDGASSIVEAQILP